MKKLTRLCAAALVFMVVPGWAAAEAPEAKLASMLAGVLPGVSAQNISASPIAGLYEVVFGANVYYVSKDGKYLLDGELVDLAERKSLTSARRDQARVETVKTLPEDGMIVYAPKKPTHTVTVFTDIDCPYCRKLHDEMGEYNKRGIKVRYLAYPRAGVGSPSYKKTVSVWCAKDRNQAMNKAKSGASVEDKTCDNPVEQHMAMGDMLGVRGTPTIILEDGRVLPGYVPAARLQALIDGTPETAAKK